MNNVKNENYILIQGWMVNELELKGNELLVYAIIHGFSQNDGTAFNGSLQYLADWTNSSRQTVINILKTLKEKGLIERVGEDVVKKTYIYIAKREVVKKIDQLKNLTRDSQKILPNNIDIINNNINTTTDQEENLSKEINLEEKISEKNSSSLIDFSFLKTYSGISDAKRNNILKIAPDMTRQEFEQKFQVIKEENKKGNIKSFDAVLVKYIKGEWNVTIPESSDSIGFEEKEVKTVNRIFFDCLGYIQFGWTRKDLLEKVGRDTADESVYVKTETRNKLLAELDRRNIN